MNGNVTPDSGLIRSNPMGDNKEKTTMRKLGFMLVTAAALITGSSANSVAAPVAPDSGIRSALADVNLVEKAQYVWGGRRYFLVQGGWAGAGSVLGVVRVPLASWFRVGRACWLERLGISRCARAIRGISRVLSSLVGVR